jgi:hypothetical protein
MAERRMFAKTIIDSDAFTEMPLSTQALYFHLSMRADDDGFLNCAQKIMRMIGAAKNDYDILLAKRFVIQLQDGICVIKHWRIHNYIQSDRYKPTVYQDEKASLSIKPNGAYTIKEQDVDTVCIQDGYSMETQVRLGEDSIVKDRIETGNADKPRGEDSRFDVFWRAYPRKTAKEEARKAYTALMKKRDAPTIDRLVESVEAHKRSDDWKKDDGRFIPHPSTYLRQGRYDDEIKDPPKKEASNADRYAITEGFKTSF